jgi:hypothetical protein
LKDLIDKLLEALPAYARQMIALLLGPKAAILQQDLESDTAVQQALTFLAISVGIAYIAQIPFLPGNQNKELQFGILAIQSALAFALCLVSLIFAWRIVGGRAAGKKVIAASCYFSGVSTILLLGLYLVAAGTFKLLDPAGFEQMISGTITDPSNPLENSAFRVYVALVCFAFAMMYLWMFFVWGAYRQLMHVSRLRSAIAFCIYAALSPFLILVQALMAVVISVNQTAPPVPDELVGVWETNRQNNANGIHSFEHLAYSFSAPESKIARTGNYLMFQLRGFTNGKCIIRMDQSESGSVLVKGSIIELAPYKRIRTTENGCTGTKSETPLDRSKSEYHYQITRQSSGWSLCLEDRFGQTCLTPKKQ